MSDPIMHYGHDGGCFRELRMSITPVRKLRFAKTAEAFLAANYKLEKEIRFG
jgi:hypothetical protein